MMITIHLFSKARVRCELRFHDTSAFGSLVTPPIPPNNSQPAGSIGSIIRGAAEVISVSVVIWKLS